MMSVLGKRKHLALLAALVGMAVLHPLSVSWNQRTQIMGDVITVVINLGVIVVIFERRWERVVALFLVMCALGASILHAVSSDRAQIAEISFHCVVAVFLAFAVAVILQHIFQRQTIRTDDVIGALCGYVLAGIAWGNLHALVYLLWPASFRIADAVAERLGHWHLQRFLFDYFSIMTLTTVGFGDIAPAGSPVYSLMWLEAMFGQFYIAVVVAQLVGLRLAEAIKGRSGE